MFNTNIAIIIPVYNEGLVLTSVIQSLFEYGLTTIIVVDDGSTVPVKLPIDHFPVILLRHRVNLGQGAALQTGITYAKKLNADIIVTFDADGQHLVNDLSAFITPIVENEADIILGSRFLPDSKTSLTFSKKLILQSARFINFLFSGVLLSDAHNGLRAMNKPAFEKITITENRMAHASEILFEIQKHKLRYKEVPVHIRYTDYSIQKGQTAWDSIKVLFDLILHKLFK